VDTANRAHLRQVRTALSNGGLTEILSGLKEGEQVVVMGQFDLQDNDRVLVNQSAPWNKS
jgi:multidrug efflux pump subunit AcrA (membrane-fusion protein)